MNVDAATRARLVGLFVTEAEETAASLRALAPRLTDGGDRQAFSEFGRIAHGLKGAAAALGYTGLATGLHDLEELALGIPGEAAERAEGRRHRVDAAIDVLAEGVARMAASGDAAFPDGLLAAFCGIVAEPGGSTARSQNDPPAPPAQRSGAGGEGGRAETGRDRSERPLTLALSPADAGERGRSALASSSTSPPTSLADRLTVPAAEVDDALRAVSSVARDTAQLHEALGGLGALGGELARMAHGVAAKASELEGMIAALRLIPAEAALSGLEEEVADLAARLGKQVEVVVSGHAVRADRRTLQAARGLVRHLVRNALDHGIEPAGARAEAGKPAAGHLSVAVDARESALVVTVADDGAGFDVPRIRGELARRGAEADALSALPDEEVLHRWALEGGSTRASATEISGRGLGLSAVAQTARAAGGTVRVQTARGEGSLVTFTLPLEVYAVEALTVAAAGRTFAVPLATIEQTVHLATAARAVHDGPAGRTLAVGETIVPLVALAEALGVAARGRAGRFAIVVRSDGALAAVAVDDVGQAVALVPSPVAGVAEPGALVTGIARLADGTPVCLLAPGLLVERARSARRAPRAAAQGGATRRGLDVVLAEDSLATREVLRVLLEEQGFRVRLAADGDEALQRIAERAPDVVVSDVNMPRRDGLALARALRSAEATARLPIVLLTSQDDDRVRAAGAAAGADAYLLKSRFNADVLTETLARLGVRAS